MNAATTRRNTSRTDTARARSHAARPVPRKYAAALLSAALFALLLFLLASPARCAQACLHGAALWAKTVLPTLFPFMVLTGLLTKLGTAQALAGRLTPLTKKCGLPGCAAYCFLVSLLSGCPVGSRTVAALYEGGAATREEAGRMSILCSTCSPMFLIGSVGRGMFASAAAGAALLAAHLAAVLGVSLCAFLLQRRKRRKATHAAAHAVPQLPLPQTNGADGILAQTVQSSTIAVLCVGGFIALFSVLTQALTDIGALAPLTKLFALPLGAAGSASAAAGAAAGLLEATQGCAAIAASGAPLALPLAAFTVTFGGSSILAQQLAFLKGAGVKPLAFIGVKALQGAAAFLFCLPIALFCTF